MRSLQLYLTQEHPCSYLSGLNASSIFIDPEEPITAELYSQLIEQGFRRSADSIYRPHCGPCTACISVRIPVHQFKPSSSQKKILRRNQDLSVTITKSQFTNEHYALYKHYIEHRHADGDMYPPSIEQFKSFLTSDFEFVRFYEFRLDKKLLAVAVTDVLPSGLSAMYTFFSPDEQRRSLGRFCILFQIQEALRLDLPHLYLGYWVKDCSKMNYKTQYQPLEGFTEQNWQALIA
ncbi:arginyltransferase [Denitrificimonas sp. JX-1]|uniref:Aspartate/glutamate leucyltransferase n=1 Tax=Denitrificimonas halotolerans TaxID=3098930 RepID=A0ABU5GRE0_9GAMM|nr:arginyltransferase [Denitrificimonas sp. JX-1]MDY7219564.1 arginyltransferase [Denitrificimonas sp. JX-1]